MNKEGSFIEKKKKITKRIVNIKKNGVNRLSIGIESFNKENLALMNRLCDFKDAKKKMELCRSMGFNNINVDFIYYT